jgi:thiosulfate/3-mercaptopyruvate sulfurtransferase
MKQDHIPGAAFLDLYGDLSDRESDVAFMMPSPAAFARALSAAGLGDDHQVVLYSSDSVM